MCRSGPAFLSVRLPETTRDRLMAAAVARGESVQGLVGNLVNRFLAEEDRTASDFALVTCKLCSHAEGLRDRGITGPYVRFGRAG